MHPVVERHAGRFLRIADRLFGDRISGFHIVGSAALGHFRPDRSDIDFVASIDDPRPDDCRRIRAVQMSSGVLTGVPALVRRRWTLPGTCNGAWVSSEQLSLPVTEIAPIAGHAGLELSCGEAFDVNPVQWKTFQNRGLTLRGRPPSELGLDPEPERLRQWNLDNLTDYWEPVAGRLLRGDRLRRPFGPARWTTAWVVLGVPRLHRTIATGDVISKEEAGMYALEVFDDEWHPIIEEALAYWRAEPVRPGFDEPSRRQRAGAFAEHVIERARRLRSDRTD